jgi:DNA-binding NarL/FixJ family response regulator
VAVTASAKQPAKALRVAMALKILIVDDNLVIRKMLRSFIEHNTDWQVCGEAENGLIAIQKVAELNPQVVILDFSMPVMNGLDAARRISADFPHVAMVLFTMHNSEQLREDARSAGVKEVVSKMESLEGSLQCLLKTVAAECET